VIVLDTSVLSVAFRRRRRAGHEPRSVRVLRQLIKDDQPLFAPGIVLQELLAGVRSDAQFARLVELTEGFPLLSADRGCHVLAAQIANACRSAGVATSTVDCLIAAQTISAACELFTLDANFARMTPHCGLRLLDLAAYAGDA